MSVDGVNPGSGSPAPGLQNAQPDFRALFENAPGLYVVLQPADHRIVAASDAVLRATMTQRQDLLGQDFFQVFPDDPSEPKADGVRNLRASLERVRSTRRPDAIPIQRYPIRRPPSQGGDFEERWWSPVNSPVLDSSGNLAWIICRLEDVTAFVRQNQGLGASKGKWDESWGRHLEAEIVRRGEELQRANEHLHDSAARLARATARFDGIISSAMDAIISTDSQQRIVMFNTAAEKMFGVSAKAVEGKSINVLIPERFRAVHSDHVKDFGNTGVSARSMGSLGMISGVRANGEEFPIEASISQVDVDGEKIFTVILRDITERKRADEALAAAKLSAERAKALAEAANRAKDRFLATLSHELRTPLTPVVAGTTLLKMNGYLDEDTRTELIEMIVRNVALEARLIDDLLDVTRVIQGKFTLEKRPVALGEIIGSAIEVCKEDIEARRLAFSFEMGDSGPYIVYADPARLQQAFWNVLKNAIKFTAPGGWVAIRCHREDNTVVVEVQDSGEGIDPSVLPILFKPFEQGGTEITRQFGGLGLGLAITKAMVEMHGGHVEAYSEGKGKGATFRIRLPFLSAAAAMPSSFDPRGRMGESAAPSPARLRILLVEDHPDTARVMRRLLMTAGHEVQTAAGVGAALEAAASGNFDLLISDLGLPDGSGLDLMQQLRQRGCKLPGIALSGYGQEEDLRRSKEAGFAIHLTKPTSLEALTAAIAGATGPATVAAG